MFRDTLHVETLSVWAERCVGLVLIAIGIWGARTALAERSDGGTDHGRRHAHADGHDSDDRERRATATGGHGGAAFAVGTVHGLAGSSHLLGVLPALAMPSDFAAGVYLVLFGVGSVTGMGTFASFVGWIAGRRRASTVRAQTALLGLSSAIAVAVGGFWILSNVWFIPR